MRHKRLQLLFGTCSLLWAGFIWSNSIKNDVESGEASGSFMNFINNIFVKLSLNISLSEYFIRKAAHFTEFAILGTLLALTVYTLTKKYKYFFAVAVSLSIACIDEIIQLFSDGRSCQFTDIMIDFSGACTGILIIILISTILNKKKVKNI